MPRNNTTGTAIPAGSVIPALAAVRRIGISSGLRRHGITPVAVTTLVLLTLVTGNAGALEWRGHVKYQGTLTKLPDDSLLQDFSDDPLRDNSLDLRLNLAGTNRGWSWQVDYELALIKGDRVTLAREGPAGGLGGSGIPDDTRRVFDLSHRISEDGERVLAHRLDRLYAGYTNASSVIRVGRQAISWGNGLIYNPVDFFNPFDPAAIDTEYKTGDDMLYTQYLRDSGDDLQAVWVVRRNDAGDIDGEVSSLALKYHGFAAATEYDLLLAEHYDERIAVVGATLDLAGAVWRGDIMLTDTGRRSVSSAVLNGSYSWVGWGRNISATIEYFHNGFGIDDGDYAPAALARHPDLVRRIERGELFTLGENYLAAAATMELTPLWLLTSTLFVNLDDDSCLLQLFSRHDLEQDLQLLLALNLPRGDDGSEFGGIDSGVAGRPLAVGATLFAQLAWYF
jgi:hypothetical protein